MRGEERGLEGDEEGGRVMGQGLGGRGGVR